MIEIIVATYNGQKYLAQQLDSIFAQSYTDFHITVSDDASSDLTLDILRAYEGLYPDKIEVLTHEIGHGSAKENFYCLLDRKMSASYICLSDQDDVWKRDKLVRSIACMQALEEEFGVDMPLLVHANADIVDANLYSTGKTMHDLVGGENTKIEKALVENCVTGSSVMVNVAFMRIYKRPAISFMHDWWLYLIALTHGKMAYILEPLLLYRQHDANVLGAKEAVCLATILKSIEDQDRVMKNYELIYAQAKELLGLYENSLSKKDKEILSAFIHMKDGNRIQKIATILKHGFYKRSLLMTIGEMLHI